MTPQSPRTPKTWFVTGASRGLGRAFAAAALAAGDRVAATTRRPGTLDALGISHPDAFAELTLDVRDRAAVLATVEQARERFGRIDVFVNNAGASYMGMVEEISEAPAPSTSRSGGSGLSAQRAAELEAWREVSRSAG